LRVRCDMKGGFESSVRYERRFRELCGIRKGDTESSVQYERRLGEFCAI
jgi:hypothetical protein